MVHRAGGLAQRTLILFASVVLAVVLVGALLLGRVGDSQSSRPNSQATRANSAVQAPAEAVTAATNLVARDLATVRSGMSRLMAARITSPTALTPAGSTLTVDRQSWRERGDNARLEIILESPGRRPVRHRLYLVREAGHWRILFSEPA
jgi:hypothetical protein